MSSFYVHSYILLPSTQWYEVYQDTEGTHSLEKTSHNEAVNNVVIVNATDDNYYKSKIVSLNEEIIALNKTIKSQNSELEMV